MPDFRVPSKRTRSRVRFAATPDGAIHSTGTWKPFWRMTAARSGNGVRSCCEELDAQRGVLAQPLGIDMNSRHDPRLQFHRLGEQFALGFSN